MRSLAVLRLFHRYPFKISLISVVRPPCLLRVILLPPTIGEVVTGVTSMIRRVNNQRPSKLLSNSQVNSLFTRLRICSQLRKPSQFLPLIYLMMSSTRQAKYMRRQLFNHKVLLYQTQDSYPNQWGACNQTLPMTILSKTYSGLTLLILPRTTQG